MCCPSPPAFLGAARNDKLVDPQRNTVALAGRLQAAGVPVTLKLYDNIDHVLLVASMAWSLRLDVAGAGRRGGLRQPVAGFRPEAGWQLSRANWSTAALNSAARVTIIQWPASMPTMRQSPRASSAAIHCGE